MAPKAIDLIGQRFGRLVVESRERKDRTTFWYCRCDCGKQACIQHTNLKWHTRSCGCLQKQAVGSRSRKPTGHKIKRAIWNYYRRNAATRKIDWFLTYEQFQDLLLQPCTYCGRVGVTVTHNGGWEDKLAHNGVDRTNSAMGYTQENSVPCCKTCNIAKNTMAVHEFLSWATVLVSYQRKVMGNG